MPAIPRVRCPSAALGLSVPFVLLVVCWSEFWDPGLGWQISCLGLGGRRHRFLSKVASIKRHSPR